MLATNFNSYNVLKNIPNFSFSQNNASLKNLFSQGLFFYKKNSTSSLQNALQLFFASKKTSIKKNFVNGTNVLTEIPKTAQLHHHSRKIKKGDVFIALPGLHAHGLQFLKQVKNKASLIIASEEHFTNFFITEKNSSQNKNIIFSDIGSTGLLLVKNIEHFANLIAAPFYGSPSLKQNVVGITGTNGKTSIAQYLAAVELHLSRIKQVAIIGTFGTQLFLKSKHLYIEGYNTTPIAIDLQRTLAYILSIGITKIFIEVTSHALALNRTQGLHLSSVIFTRLTPDHLDFHGSMELYFAAKKKILFLLHQSKKANKFAIVAASLNKYGLSKDVSNFNFPVLQLEDSSKKVFKNLPSTFYFCSSLLNPQSSNLNLTVFNSENLIKSNFYLQGIVAGFQAENMAFVLLHMAMYKAATMGKALTMGQALSKPILQKQRKQNSLYNVVAKNLQGLQNNKRVLNAIGKTTVTGRFMQIKLHSIYIDYAHTPDALQNLLEATQHLPNKEIGGRLIVLFGCGGDRDVAKRASMGKIAANYSDICVVTSDNPRSEDPKKIINNILDGVNSELKKQKKKTVVAAISNRTTAIEMAVENMRPGDVLLIAGKGHEAVQITKAGSVVFNEEEIVKQSIKNIFAGSFSFEILKNLSSACSDNSHEVLINIFSVIENKNNSLKSKNKSKNISLLSENYSTKAKGVFYNTREWLGEEIFFSFDGNGKSGFNYLKKKHLHALKIIVVNKKHKQAAQNFLASHGIEKNTHKNNLLKIIFVDDVFNAYATLAKYKMQCILALYSNSKVIGVTGSAGKSSLKEGLAVALKSFCLQEKSAAKNSFKNVFVSKGNFNNHIGLPQNVFLINKPYKYYVFELGMSNAGEISKLANVITAHYAFITSIMAAHIENFESLDKIAEAKAELLSCGFYKPGNFKKNVLFLPSNIAFKTYFEKMAEKHSWKVVSIPVENFENKVVYKNVIKKFFSKIKVTPINLLQKKKPIANNQRRLEKNFDKPLNLKLLQKQINANKKNSSIEVKGIYPHGLQLFSAVYVFINYLLITENSGNEAGYNKQTKLNLNNKHDNHSFLNKAAHEICLEVLKQMPESLMPRRFQQVCSSPTVIDDAYNANPTSMVDFLTFGAKLISKIPKTITNKKCVFVLGDMLELGRKSNHFHDSIIHEALTLVHKRNNFYFLFVGSNFNAAFKRFLLHSKVSSKKVAMIEWEKLTSSKKILNNNGNKISVKNSSSNKTISVNENLSVFNRIQHFNTTLNAKKFLVSVIKKNDFVFLKASNAMNFNAIVKSFLKK